jgi:hypothetical protein
VVYGDITSFFVATKRKRKEKTKVEEFAKLVRPLPNLKTGKQEKITDYVPKA